MHVNFLMWLVNAQSWFSSTMVLLTISCWWLEFLVLAVEEKRMIMRTNTGCWSWLDSSVGWSLELSSLLYILVEKPAFVPIGKLHRPRVPLEEWIYKPLWNALFSGNPGKEHHKLELTWLHLVPSLSWLPDIEKIQDRKICNDFFLDILICLFCWSRREF